MIVLGLGGTNGSGKDTVAKMLEERHNFLNVSASELLVEELNRRGQPIDRKHKSALSAEWRREHGMGVIVDKALEYFNQQKHQYSGFIVGSLRHPGETDRIHELGGKQIWVDADPKVRYERIQANLAERADTHASEGSFEKFLAEEEREMHPEGDAATLNMAGVKEQADIFLSNSGNDIDAFKDEAEKALGLNS
jgi:dephospho-CoA kinase